MATGGDRRALAPPAGRRDQPGSQRGLRRGQSSPAGGKALALSSQGTAIRTAHSSLHSDQIFAICALQKVPSSRGRRSNHSERRPRGRWGGGEGRGPGAEPGRALE